MSYLIDTNVISETEQAAPDAKVVNWLNEQTESGLFLSALTIGELRKGIERLPNGRKKTHLQRWLEDLRLRFATRIIPITERTFLIWAKMYADFEGNGIVRPIFDSLLEATALEHDLILVTRNTKNFHNSSATIFNPWEG